jgi:glutathione synthase/RimK-type ligase-like ATP-grasp enzyme
MAPLGGSQTNLPAAGAAGLLPYGMARLAKLAFDGADLKPLWRELYDRFMAGSDEAGSLMDLATVEQLFGNGAAALACQKAALERVPLYRSPAAVEAPALRLLAFAAPGDIGTNAPLEFMLEGTDIALDTLYVEPGRTTAPPSGGYDLAIVAAGESDANRPILAEIARIAPMLAMPLLNDPARIAQLSRDGVAGLFTDHPGILAPPVRRLGRSALAEASEFPFIVRPVDSHAGRGLARIDDAAQRDAYLGARGEDRFFATPFVDYRSGDGLFRKYRVAFIGGAPFACHMAISDQWMIYYLNAGMGESAAKRAEEERFMRDFDDDFARRHEAALAAIAGRIGLDYFAIDCGEMPDRRLVLFEADVAMIVHAMDPPELFPYKRPQMRKVFDAFRAMLLCRAGAAR